MTYPYIINLTPEPIPIIDDHAGDVTLPENLGLYLNLNIIISDHYLIF